MMISRTGMLWSSVKSLGGTLGRRGPAHWQVGHVLSYFHDHRASLSILHGICLSSDYAESVMYDKVDYDEEEEGQPGMEHEKCTTPPGTSPPSALQSSEETSYDYVSTKICKRRPKATEHMSSTEDIMAEYSELGETGSAVVEVQGSRLVPAALECGLVPEDYSEPITRDGPMVSPRDTGCQLSAKQGLARELHLHCSLAPGAGHTPHLSDTGSSSVDASWSQYGCVEPSVTPDSIYSRLKEPSVGLPRRYRKPCTSRKALRPVSTTAAELPGRKMYNYRSPPQQQSKGTQARRPASLCLMRRGVTEALYEDILPVLQWGKDTPEEDLYDDPVELGRGTTRTRDTK